MTAVDLAPVPAPSDLDEDIVHIGCCAQPDLALCGINVVDTEPVTGTELVCVTCDHLEATGEPCPRFGRCTHDTGVLS